MPTKPRRVRKQWLIGAPDYVYDCLDNGGKTADRYTILFGGWLFDALENSYPALGLSDDCDRPNGYSQWTMVKHYNKSVYGKRIHWKDLPTNVRKHIELRAMADG